MLVPLTTTTFVAAVAPNVTVAPAAKLVPVIVTEVPPAVGPLFGEMLVTVGGTGPPDAVRNATICMIHAPDGLTGAVALLEPAVVTNWSSAISPSGDVNSRFVKPVPAPVVVV